MREFIQCASPRRKNNSPFKGQLFFYLPFFSIPADRSIEREREMNEALSSSSSSLKGTPQPKAWKKGLPAEEEEENLGKRTKGRRKKKRKKRKKRRRRPLPLFPFGPLLWTSEGPGRKKRGKRDIESCTGISIQPQSNFGFLRNHLMESDAAAKR